MKFCRTHFVVVVAVAAFAALAAQDLSSAFAADDSFRFDISIGDSSARRAPGGLSPQSGEGGTIEFGNWNPGQLTDADLTKPDFQAFPNVFRGTDYTGLVLTSFSSRGGVWFIRVRLLSPLSSGANTIPVEASSIGGPGNPNDNKGGTLRWFGFAVAPEATGTFANPLNGVAFCQPYSYMTTTDFTCYTSGPNESNGSRVSKSHYGFFVLVPPDQRPGTYSGEVQFTITE